MVLLGGFFKQEMSNHPSFTPLVREHLLTGHDKHSPALQQYDRRIGIVRGRQGLDDCCFM